MKLYHVGHSIIEKPDINVGRENADFGKGFYLSDDYSFSLRWAKIRPFQKTYVNIYELEEEGLNILKLERDIHWFRYIYLNRRNSSDIYDDYDIIIGPISNDTIFDTFGIFTSGVFSDEEALSLMQIGNCYTQVVIKSDKAAKKLKLLDAKAVDEKKIEEYRDTVRKEEKEYQELLNKAIAKI